MTHDEAPVPSLDDPHDGHSNTGGCSSCGSDRNVAFAGRHQHLLCATCTALIDDRAGTDASDEPDDLYDDGYAALGNTGSYDAAPDVDGYGALDD